MEFLFVVIIVYGLLQLGPGAWITPEARPFLALGVGMILTGIEHVVNESEYETIMQSWIPNKPLVIRISVAVRILSGVGLFFPGLRKACSIACLILYLVVLPVNLRVAFAGHKIEGLNIPAWRRWLRLGLHFGWLAWSYWCVRMAANA